MGVRAYDDVTTKISRIDRLPNLLGNGAPLIILYGAMFDFVDVTDNGFCVGTFNSPFASSVHWGILFKKYKEMIILTIENRKQEWIYSLF